MAHTLTRSLSATAAISAVLALGSTPSFAQDAAPVIQLQPPVAASAPSVSTDAAAPAVVIPDVSTQQAATPAEPASATTAEPAAAASQTRATRNARVETPTRSNEAAARRSETTAETQRPAPVPAPEPAASTTTPARPSSANILNDNPTTPIGEAQPAQATPAVAPASDDGIPGEAIAGILAVLGIGAVGYAVMNARRRRTARQDAEYATTPLEPESARAEPVAAAPAMAAINAAPAPAIHYGFRPATGGDADAELIERQPVDLAPPVARSVRRTRDSFTIPQHAPATTHERESLLDRMVEAEPDEANPFVSRKARRKRARLLLQQHENQAAPEAPFDWRTYKSHSSHATRTDAELVTA